MSTRLKPYRPTHISAEVSADTRPTLDRYSTDTRPTLGRYIDRVSTATRPIYRPIVSTDTSYSKHDPTIEGDPSNFTQCNILSRGIIFKTEIFNGFVLFVHINVVYIFFVIGLFYFVNCH